MRMNRAERTKLLQAMVAIAAEAGARIHALAVSGIVAREKADLSPVTDADEAAEAMIAERLARLLPGIPMIAEEAAAAGSRVVPGETFFLVDPIDGTREFVAGRPEYTVNIALLIEGTPALGVIYAPALHELYAGGDDGAVRLALPPGADHDCIAPVPIRVRPRPAQMIAAVSHSHLDRATEAWLKERGIAQALKIGSSIKFARIAEGSADVYPRLAPVSEWDIAAGHAIVRAAGGTVTAPDGSVLRYGKTSEGYGVKAFIASGGAL